MVAAVLLVLLPLILGRRPNSFLNIIWLCGSSMIYCLRAVTIINCLKLLAVTSFHEIVFNSPMVLLSRGSTPALGGHPSENPSFPELAITSKC